MAKPDADDAAERTRLWNEWLKTPYGKTYEAGWPDYESQLHAMHGKLWVEEQMLDAERAAHAATAAAAEALAAEARKVVDSNAFGRFPHLEATLVDFETARKEAKP